jgi:hypothetical protein
MRTLILAAVMFLAAASTAEAQVGQVQVLGPYQPNPFGGHVYFQPAFRNPYSGYVAAPAYRGRGYDHGYYEGRFSSGRVYRARW